MKFRNYNYELQLIIWYLLTIFGIQTERINNMQSPLPISTKRCYFESIFQSSFMSRTF